MRDSMDTLLQDFCMKFLDEYHSLKEAFSFMIMLSEQFEQKKLSYNKTAHYDAHIPQTQKTKNNKNEKKLNLDDNQTLK